MNTVSTVEVDISVVLGNAHMPIHQLLRMGRGAVIELVTEANEEVFILANNVPVAKGDVVINGENIAVAVTSILKKSELRDIAA